MTPESFARFHHDYRERLALEHGGPHRDHHPYRNGVLPFGEPEDRPMMTPESLAQLFHSVYERLAPEHCCQTREASAKPWGDVPPDNRALMIATCGEVLDVVHRYLLLELAAMALRMEIGDEERRVKVPEGPAILAMPPVLHLPATGPRWEGGGLHPIRLVVGEGVVASITKDGIHHRVEGHNAWEGVPGSSPTSEAEAIAHVVGTGVQMRVEVPPFFEVQGVAWSLYEDDGMGFLQLNIGHNAHARALFDPSGAKGWTIRPWGDTDIAAPDIWTAVGIIIQRAASQGIGVPWPDEWPAEVGEPDDGEVRAKAARRVPFGGRRPGRRCGCGGTLKPSATATLDCNRCPASYREDGRHWCPSCSTWPERWTGGTDRDPRPDCGNCMAPQPGWPEPLADAPDAWLDTPSMVALEDLQDCHDVRYVGLDRINIGGAIEAPGATLERIVARLEPDCSPPCGGDPECADPRCWCDSRTTDARQTPSLHPASTEPTPIEHFRQLTRQSEAPETSCKVCDGLGVAAVGDGEIGPCLACIPEPVDRAEVVRQLPDAGVPPPAVERIAGHMAAAWEEFDGAAPTEPAPPPSAGWRMSDNSIVAISDALEAIIDRVPLRGEHDATEPETPAPSWHPAPPPRIQCRWRDGCGGEGTATPDAAGWCFESDAAPSSFEIFAALPDGWSWAPAKAPTPVWHPTPRGVELRVEGEAVATIEKEGFRWWADSEGAWSGCGKECFSDAAEAWQEVHDWDASVPPLPESLVALVARHHALRQDGGGGGSPSRVTRGDSMTPAQIEVARLMASPACPEGLVEVLVSTGPHTKVPLVDLTSAANGGVLLEALGKLCGTPDFPQPGAEWLDMALYPLVSGWRLYVGSVRYSPWGTTRETLAEVNAEHPAHAAALAFLAVSR